MSGLRLARRVLRTLPAGLLGMVGLILLAELALARSHQEFTRFHTHDWSVTGRAAYERVRDCGVLCFGDSLVKFGVAPKVLDPSLGLRSYNLAICGGQASSSYFLLRRALNAGARPRAIVVGFAPHLSIRSPRWNRRQWPELVNVAELADLAWAARSGEMLASLVLGRLFISVRDRHEIRTFVLAQLQDKRVSLRVMIPAFERNLDVNRGALLAVKSEPAAAVPTPELSQFEDYPAAWRCHRVNDEYTRRILALAAQHDITVFWLLTPTWTEVQERRERLGIDARYERYVMGLQAQFPNLFVVDGRHAGYDHAHFLDPLHLNRHGAAALSARLAEIMRAHLTRRSPASDTAPRWVTFTRRAADERLAVEAELEDLERSRLALLDTPSSRKERR